MFPWSVFLLGVSGLTLQDCEGETLFAETSRGTGTYTNEFEMNSYPHLYTSHDIDSGSSTLTYEIYDSERAQWISYVSGGTGLTENNTLPNCAAGQLRAKLVISGTVTSSVFVVKCGKIA